ncbi:MAG: carboxypeptidase regulatory-like domain-containing protein [Anaerolineae bacterium]
MTCEKCGAPMRADQTICAECGTERSPSPRRGRRWLWVTGLTLLGLVLLALIAGVGWSAYRQGLALRAERERQAAAMFVARADALAAAGEPDLAQQELIEALRLAPDYPEAQQRLSIVARDLNNAEDLPALPNVPTPAPTPTPSPAEILADADRATAEGNLALAITRLQAVRAAAPDFQSDGVKQRLARLYLADGQQLVLKGKMDEAIARFQSAAAENPADFEADTQLDLAQTYVDALAQWGKDWPTVTNKLESLYARAPQYKDTADRLAEAYAQNGDRLLALREACLADGEYTRALAVKDTEDVRARRVKARQGCGGFAETLPARRMTPQLLEVREIGGDDGQIVGRVVDRRGQPLSNMYVTVQPAAGALRGVNTDRLGQFQFSGLPSQQYFVDIPAAIGPALPVQLQAGGQAVVLFVEQ